MNRRWDERESVGGQRGVVRSARREEKLRKGNQI